MLKETRAASRRPTIDQDFLNRQIAEVERKLRWDRFLDAYSAYLRNPTLRAAASLKLRGGDLEDAETGFSFRAFEERLGWAAAA